VVGTRRRSRAWGSTPKPTDGRFELLVDAYAEWRELRLAVESEGRTYESGSLQGGRMVRSHPAVQQLADAWRRVRLALGEFGLTPSSRSKVAAGGEEDEDPLEEFLGGGRRGK
jgi:P27 family predicted phage terminase small subunit